jgi:NAD+ synthase
LNTGELAERLVSWIREKTLAAGGKGVVLGLSGGVDSSVLAVLCQRAFPKNTLAVLMPCYSNKEDMAHAKMVANKFSIPTRTVVLDSVFDGLLKVLPDDRVDPDTRRLAQANIKARLRMLTLYYFANQLNYMVVGAGNRDELSIGYFTKYGDGGVDIQPMGNLLKGQIRELARFLAVPEPIIIKPPSADLWEGQTDEGEFGFSYDELDRYLSGGEASAEIKKRIESMISATEHKRQPPPMANLSGER